MGQNCCQLNNDNLKDEILESPKRSLLTELESPKLNKNLKIYEAKIEKYPEHILSSGAVYKGPFNAGKLMHGIGKIIWPNKSYYIGHFENNVSSGHGILVLNEDEMMEGIWKNDQLNGMGSINTNEYTYHGEFLNHQPHGKGEIFYANGTKYNGEFCSGYKQGKGKLTIGDNTYEGNLYENMKEGHGICNWDDGSKYEGNWVKNKMEGRGIFYWPDGSVYEGEYENGLKHGYGILKGSDGKTTYKGYWSKGERYSCHDLP